MKKLTNVKYAAWLTVNNDHILYAYAMKHSKKSRIQWIEAYGENRNLLYKIKLKNINK